VQRSNYVFTHLQLRASWSILSATRDPLCENSPKPCNLQIYAPRGSSSTSFGHPATPEDFTFSRLAECSLYRMRDVRFGEEGCVAACASFVGSMNCAPASSSIYTMLRLSLGCIPYGAKLSPRAILSAESWPTYVRGRSTARLRYWAHFHQTVSKVQEGTCCAGHLDFLSSR
jgi:hypothetical protein